MSAGLVPRPAVAPAAPGAGRRPGHTRITSTALHHTLEAITAAAFGVPAGEVKARVTDEQGNLHVSVAVALPMPSLSQAAWDAGAVPAAGGTFYERSERARTNIIADASSIAGARVARVDIRLTGRYQPKESALR